MIQAGGVGGVAWPYHKAKVQGGGQWAYNVALGQSADPLLGGRRSDPKNRDYSRLAETLTPLRGHHRIPRRTLGLGQSSDHLEEQLGKLIKDFPQYSGAKRELSRELRRSDETIWTRVAVMADRSASGSALFHV